MVLEPSDGLLWYIGRARLAPGGKGDQLVGAVAYT